MLAEHPPAAIEGLIPAYHHTGVDDLLAEAREDTAETVKRRKHERDRSTPRADPIPGLGLENDDPQPLAGQRQRGNEPHRTRADDHTRVTIPYTFRHQTTSAGGLVTAVGATFTETNYSYVAVLTQEYLG